MILTEEEWHQYIQDFKPEPEQVSEYIKDLWNYAKRGNMESGIAKFRIDGVARKYPHVLNTMEYRQITLEDKQNQRTIQEGFFR